MINTRDPADDYGNDNTSTPYIFEHPPCLRRGLLLSMPLFKLTIPKTRVHFLPNFHKSVVVNLSGDKRVAPSLPLYLYKVTISLIISLAFRFPSLHYTPRARTVACRNQWPAFRKRHASSCPRLCPSAVGGRTTSDLEWCACMSHATTCRRVLPLTPSTSS